MSPNSLSAGNKLKGSMLLASLIALFSMLVVACGGPNTGPTGNNGGNTAAGPHVLKVATQSYDFAQAGFNPFNAHANAGQYLIYEPLEFVNVNDGSFTPMLAMSHEWNADNTAVTFHLRDGVKWNDGQAFSSDDVAFTFNMLLQNTALPDGGGVRSYVKSVAAADPKTVTLTLQSAFPPALTSLASKVNILPKHVFATVSDPAKYLTDKPVGTGPFTLDSYKPDVAVYKKFAGYWDAANVAIDEVRFPEYKSNDTAILALASGKVDAGAYFAQNLKDAYVAKDPAHNKMFMDPINLYNICPNLKNPLLADKAVRLAMTTALDRTSIAAQATGGLEPPGSLTGLILPTAKNWLDPNYSSLAYAADTAKAEKFLTDAGYAKGSDGIYAKGGKRLSFELRSVDSYTDWNSAAKLVADQMKAVGIEIKNVTVGEDNYYTLRADGKFDYQLQFCGMVGGVTPYTLYNSYLNSTNIGSGKTNFVAWNDATTDQLLKDYVSTTDTAKQKTAIAGIEKIFVENAPFFPLWTGVDYAEYSTRNYTGWPDETNPYASGSANTGPDFEIVIKHLKPVA